MTVRELEARIKAAGIVMSDRQVVRHCKAGTFDAIKIPAANNVEQWFIALSSVEKGIADIKALQEQRSRHSATRQDVTDTDTPPEPHVALRETGSDMSGHDASRQDVTDKENSVSKGPTQHDTSGRVTTSDTDIFEHPYVKRLEDQVEKWQDKYEQQVRRTEEIQSGHQKELVELQRMTAVASSKTLGDYMLKVRELFLRQGSQSDKGEASDQPTS
jgi:hypothetical protein